jgi:glucose/arabinose dehydrogenase
VLRRTSAALAATFLLHAPAFAEVPTQVETIRTAAGDIEVTEVAGGLVHPWGLTFLPDGRMLVTERPGRLRLITADGELRPDPVQGTPQVFARGQGGLLDVVADPDFAQNQLVWLSFAEPGAGGTAGTAVGRGRLEGDRLEGFETVWRQTEKVDGPNHFGSRIVFADADTLFVALAERFKFEPAQDLSNTLGTVIRITRDGAPAPGNPFLDRPDAAGEIFSYGHRNIQAAAIDPATGDLYVAEMGPLGGDELNRIEAGANYGWPVVSWGSHYDGADIPDPPTRPEFHDSVTQWTPVIAPSGMIFYQGDQFPEFQGDALIGGLVSEGITRVELADGAVAHQDHIPLSRRIREVEEGPDGNLYVLTDHQDGALWKLQPLSASN